MFPELGLEASIRTNVRSFGLDQPQRLVEARALVDEVVDQGRCGSRYPAVALIEHFLPSADVEAGDAMGLTSDTKDVLIVLVVYWQMIKSNSLVCHALVVVGDWVAVEGDDAADLVWYEPV